MQQPDRLSAIILGPGAEFIAGSLVSVANKAGRAIRALFAEVVVAQSVCIAGQVDRRPELFATRSEILGGWR